MKLDPLNFKYCYGNHRWSAAKQWTFYLAEGVDILTVEWGRHQAESRSPKLAMNANKREVFEIRVAKILTIDLRDANVLKTLGGKGAPNCFLDKGKANQSALSLVLGLRNEVLLVKENHLVVTLIRKNLVTVPRHKIYLELMWVKFME